MRSSKVRRLASMGWKKETEDFLMEFGRFAYSTTVYIRMYLKVKEKKKFLFIPYTKTKHKIVASTFEHDRVCHFGSIPDEALAIIVAKWVDEADKYITEIEKEELAKDKAVINYEKQQLASALERQAKQQQN